MLCCLVAVFVVFPILVGKSSYLTYMLLTFFIFSVFGHAWNLLAGYCGLLSFGNQVYVGIGGYTMAMLSYYGGMNVWLALPLAGVTSALFAYLLSIPVREAFMGMPLVRATGIAVLFWVGLEVVFYLAPQYDVFRSSYSRRVLILLLIFLGALPLLRLQGAYFAIATWLVASAVGTGFNEWEVVGAGAGMRITSDATMEQVYYGALALLVLSTFFIWMLLRSRYGLALTAVRDDEEAARTVGIDIRRVKSLVFVLSGGLTGLAAGLFYIDSIIITPSAAFTVFWSAYFAFVVVVGGLGTLTGPLVGALAYVVVDRVIAPFLTQGLLILGAASIFFVLFLPRGLVGYINGLRK
jgi:branched-chain amino acid transport system permease protein